MLRLSKWVLAGIGSAALLASAANAQAGLGQRLDAQEQKLTQDEQTCQPVNLAEYAQLLQEASQNKARADKMAKKGVPVNQAQVDADLAKAMMLFARAQMAMARQCMMQAQQQQQAQPQAQPPAPQTGQAPATTPGVQGTGGGLDSQLAEAEKKLDDDIKACRPITSEDVDRYTALRQQAERNYNRARKTQEAGLPIELNKVLSDADRARSLFERASRAYSRQPACPPKREAQTEPPPPTPPKTIGTHPLPSWARDILNAHNAARAAVGSPPVKWDPLLQEHATARAGEIAQLRQLIHAPREGRGTERENILSAPIGWSPDQMMGVWVGEKRYFHPGVFPDVCDGDWSQCAHYTQMIWSTTTDIGCGFAPGGGFNWLVCRYNPGGNKDGKPVGQPPSIASTASTRPPPAGLLDYEFCVRSNALYDYESTAWMMECRVRGSGSAATDGDAGLDPGLDTKVEQPTIGNQELFRLAQPNEPLPDPL